ncbi:MAG: V-type ATP synthase subunit E [Ethanoligenens sp.]
MSQTDVNLKKFTSAVLSDAEAQRSKIMAEIEDYRQREMQRAEEDVLHEAYNLIQSEIASIRNKQSREISLAELEGRRKLLTLREEITQKVFKEAADQIVAYTQTDAYSDWLCDALKKSSASMADGSLIIEVKRGEHTPADKLIAATGRKATVQEVPGILIGGFILVNNEKGFVIDETLDQKLHNEKDWFAASSGLTLRL